jgi:hypothetical protein
MKRDREEVKTRRQAAEIRRYWEAEGYAVETWVERVDAARNSVSYWTVRSNLVNGHPTRKLKS